MISCCFVSGDSSTIGDLEFDAVGQEVELAENDFIEVIKGGAAFIPRKYFNEIGFTADELAAHGPVGERFEPPASFCNKLAQAQQVFRDIRGRVLEGSQHLVLAEIMTSQGE